MRAGLPLPDDAPHDRGPEHVPRGRDDAGYAPVAARLAEEHLVVHAHLERVDDLAVAVRTDPGRIGELVAAVADLRADLESHFAYEETEMSEPLGLLGLGI